MSFLGCRARNRTWVKGFKVLRATSTQRGSEYLWCRRSGSNRHESRLSTVFETVASANSATPAWLERKTRFELATSSLARRHSTTELLPLILLICWCRRRDLNPHRLSPTTPSRWRVYQLPPLRQLLDAIKPNGRSGRIRTRDRWFWRPLLYQLSYTPIKEQFTITAR
jgi:hypothetical protein